MKLVRPALLVVAAALWVSAAYACNDKTGTKTTAAAADQHGSACSMAKNGTSATTASVDEGKACCANKASTKGVKNASMSAAASGDGCAMKGAAASNDQCAMKGASMASCPMHGKNGAMKGASMANCSMHKGTSATAASMASSCSGQAMLGGRAMAHGDCNACEDMAECDEQIMASGARVQVVPLKNGVMYVYTSDSPERVKAVQSVVAQRNLRVSNLLAAGDNAKMCTGCKQIRGAMASGKMNREVVNVENGALTLVTSNDKAMVSKIVEASNTMVAVRTTH